MSDHDEYDDPSPEELAQAEALAGKVDDLVAGKAMPKLGDADEQELLRNSAMIRAAHHEAVLDSDRQTSLIEEAMSQAMPSAHKEEVGKVLSLDAARAKRRRTWSLGVGALVAAAAIALLWFRLPGKDSKQALSSGTGPVATLQELPDNQQSRASDPLVGRIAPEDSGMSSSRLDQIYGDRLGGYRALRYSRLVGKQ